MRCKVRYGHKNVDLFYSATVSHCCLIFQDSSHANKLPIHLSLVFSTALLLEQSNAPGCPASYQDAPGVWTTLTDCTYLYETIYLKDIGGRVLVK